MDQEDNTKVLDQQQKFRVQVNPHQSHSKRCKMAPSNMRSGGGDALRGIRGYISVPGVS